MSSNRALTAAPSLNVAMNFWFGSARRQAGYAEVRGLRRCSLCLSVFDTLRQNLQRACHHRMDE